MQVHRTYDGFFIDRGAGIAQPADSDRMKTEKDLDVPGREMNLLMVDIDGVRQLRSLADFFVRWTGAVQ